MRVWLITIGEPLPIDDGDPRIMRSGLLARELISNGHEVVWWTARFDHTGKRHRPGPSKRKLSDGTELRLLRSCGYGSNVSVRRWVDHVMLAMAFLFTSIGRRSPDVVIASLPPPELALVATLRCRSAHRVVDVRDKWPDVLGAGSLSRVKRVGFVVMAAAARAALRRADAIWASSEPYLTWGLAHAARGRRRADVVIPHGYDAPDVRPTRRGDDGPIELVFAGALTDWFDFGPVLDALGEVNRAGIRARLTICGAGPQRERLEKLHQQRADVRLLGYLDRTGLWSVFGRSDLGIAPYIASGALDDSLPNKIIEYCAAGLPVVTSLRGSARELIGSAGAGYQYDDSTELAAILDQLHGDRQRLAQSRQRARALFDDRFTAAKVYGAAVQHLESERMLVD